MVLYGDTMVNVDLERMLSAHSAAKADATLFLHPNDHPHDSDLVEHRRGRSTFSRSIPIRILKSCLPKR